MSLSIDNYLGVHATALTLRSQRAEILANNMANADTPNFKARDIDFRKVLQQTSSHAINPVRTHEAHITVDSMNHGDNPMYRVPQKASLDGNTVDMDTERGEFTENAVRYQASLEFLNKRIKGILNALRGE